MPYEVSLTLVGAERVQLPEIHLTATPRVGEIITVNIDNRSTRAQVTGIRNFPSKSPGTAVETVDQVDAQEM